jgi:hypothetical protein
MTATNNRKLNAEPDANQNVERQCQFKSELEFEQQRHNGPDLPPTALPDRIRSFRSTR